jgi:hypothetical protein
MKGLESESAASGPDLSAGPTAPMSCCQHHAGWPDRVQRAGGIGSRGPPRPSTPGRPARGGRRPVEAATNPLVKGASPNAATGEVTT